MKSSVIHKIPIIYVFLLLGVGCILSANFAFSKLTLRFRIIEKSNF